MPRFADPVRAPSAKKSAPSSTAVRPPARRLAPAQQAALSRALQLRAGERAAAAPSPEAPSRAGLPERLKAGVERLSGLAMGDVRVHRDSPEPAKLGALAYTKGSEIHLGPGQEEHLPHEAWHVVQQKQGRVQATTQMKGVALNDDVALEAEADRVASLGAFASADTAAGRLRQVRPVGATAQRTVKYKTRDLTDKEAASSPLLTTLNDVPNEFLLRPDWVSTAPTENINILDASRRYLLGEQHNIADRSGKVRQKNSYFDEDVAPWGLDVPKMTEGFAEIPGREGRYFKAPSGFSSLENAHLHALNIALIAHNGLNVICKADGNGASLLDDKLDTRNYLHSLVNTLFQYVLYYNDNPEDGLIKDFAYNVMDGKKYGYELTRMLGLMDKAEAILKKEAPSAEFSSLQMPATPEECVQTLDTIRDVLPQLIGDLRDLVGVKPDTEEGKTLTEVSARSSETHPKTLMVLKDRREAEMAARISSRDPPCLVQLGDDHVEPVATLIGSSAVKARHPTRLKDLTSAATWVGILGVMKAVRKMLGVPELPGPGR